MLTNDFQGLALSRLGFGAMRLPLTDPDVSRTPHYNTVLRRNTWQFDAFFLNLRPENQIIIII